MLAGTQRGALLVWAVPARLAQSVMDQIDQTLLLNGL